MFFLISKLAQLETVDGGLLELDACPLEPDHEILAHSQLPRKFADVPSGLAAISKASCDLMTLARFSPLVES